MAWIYLAESQESQQDYQSGLDQWPTVRLQSTRGRICSIYSGKEKSQEPQYGMTLGRSKDSTSPFLSILYMGDSHARTLALQEMARAWKESEAVFSLKSCAWSKKLNQHLYSWKMFLQSEPGDYRELLKKFPRWGMTVGGRLYQPQSLEPRTYGRDGGFSPTPTASNYGSNQSASDGARVRPSLQSIAKMIPTQKVSQSTYSRQKNGSVSVDLPGLARNFLPTPQARDGKDGLTPKPHGRHSPSVAVVIAESGHCGYLNPRFVEVLMGYPIGWTSLSPWATRLLHSKYRQRLKN